MSTTAPSKRTKRTNTLPSGQGLAGWAQPFFASTVGGKYVVAVTGLIATAFVIVHMLGNLQVFLGQEAINHYARSLKANMALLWAARIFLLGTFVLHVVLALRLNYLAKRARPVKYVHEATVQASFASRHMVITGLVILAFTLFHIAHYTLGVVKVAEVPDRFEPQKTHYVNYLNLVDAQGNHDVYSMMIYGFSDPLTAVLYVVAQVFLFLHLTHGVASMFQSLGLNSPRAQGLLRRLAWFVAVVVCGGNILMVVTIWLAQIPGGPLKEAGILQPNPMRPGVTGMGGPPQLQKKQ